MVTNTPTTLIQGQPYMGGTVGFDTATGAPLAPGATTPSTQTFGAINGATPILTPAPTNPAATLNSLVASTNTQVNDANTADTTANTNVNTTTSDITNLMKQLGGQSADQLTAENAAGLPTLNKDLLDLQNTARQQSIEYNSTPYSLAGQGRGITTGILRGQEAVKQRQVGLDLLVTNSNIAAKQGNITLAQNLADKAIAAKYDPIKQAIETKKFLLDSQSKLLSSADQKLANAQKDKLNLQLKQIDKQAETDTQIQQMLIDANSMQAPNSVIKAANGLVAKGGTPAQVAQALGQYTGAAAKATLLQEQIKTEKAQREKIYSDINNSKDKNKVLSIEEAIKLGVPYGTTVAQAQSQALGQAGKPIPLNATQTSALSSAQELLDKVNNPGALSRLFGSVPIGKASIGLTAPGTDRANFIVNFNNLKSLLSLDNVKLLKGQGQVSDAERQLLADASAKLDRSQTPEEFKKNLTNIITTFQKASPEHQYVDGLRSAIDASSNNALTPGQYADSLLVK